MTKIFEKKFYSDSMASYLIIIPEKDIVDTISMNMMKNNTIDGFLNMECRYIDNKMLLYYNINGMQSLSEYIAQNRLDYNFIKGLYRDIINAVYTGEAYFLNENTYMMSAEYIYCDRKSKKAKFCCIPGWSGEFFQSVKELTQELIEHVDHKDVAAVEFIYGIYEVVTEKGFSISEVSQYIERFKVGMSNQDRKQDSGNVQGKNEDDKNTYNGCQSINSEDNIKNSEQKKSLYGIYLISGNYCNGDKHKEHEVIWLEDVQEYAVGTHRNIKVGRIEEENNIVIPYSYISRKHAMFIIEDENLYIVDNGSTNGTYINNKKISANEKVQCHEGDDISFADISYKLILKNC